MDNNQRTTREPEFQAFRKRVLIGSQALCLFGLVFGIFQNMPYLIGLGVIGLVVSYFKLTALKD